MSGLVLTIRLGDVVYVGSNEVSLHSIQGPATFEVMVNGTERVLVTSWRWVQLLPGVQVRSTIGGIDPAMPASEVTKVRIQFNAPGVPVGRTYPPISKEKS